LVTAEWLKSRIERREAKRLDEARAEGRKEGRAEGREEVLGVLGKDAREDAERKLGRNGSSDTRD
jgi:flagellar biosynthesis/type III secretory pathway protein FliH